MSPSVHQVSGLNKQLSHEPKPPVDIFKVKRREAHSVTCGVTTGCVNGTGVQTFEQN